jgi:hypothetical protein
MTFPPLHDPEPREPGAEGRPEPSRERPAPPPSAGHESPGPGPAEDTHRREPSAAEPPEESPIYAAPGPAGDEDGDVGDDDLEDLIEQVDLDDIEEFDDDEDVPLLTEEPPAQAEAPAPSPADNAARYRPAGDEPIPMLTEVVQVPRYDTEDLPQTLAEVDWGDLAQRVRENVLERLLRRSDALLDAQLQDTLVPVLERAAETVAHELHDALNRMIRDIVARAVTEELTRLHAEIAKRNRSRPS